MNHPRATQLEQELSTDPEGLAMIGRKASLQTRRAA